MQATGGVNMTDEGVRRHPAYMERSCRPSFNVLSRCNLSLPNRVKCQNDKQHFFYGKLSFLT